MKARAVKCRGNLSSQYYWAVEVTLDDDTMFVLRLSDYEYGQLVRKASHEDEPDHDNSSVAALMGLIAGRITDD